MPLAIALIFLLIVPFDTFNNPFKPDIKADIAPEKVKNGDTMHIEVEISDTFGVSEVQADMGGIETILLQRVGGTEKDGIWQAEWKVHDAEDKDYVAIIKAKNKLGISSSKELNWSDPSYVTYILYLTNNTADTTSGWPANNKLFETTVVDSTIAARRSPGFFDASAPGAADAGIFNSTCCDLATTTAMTELIDAVATSFPSSTSNFVQGWIWANNLTGQRVQAGNWSFKLNLTIGLAAGAGDIHDYAARVLVVSKNGSIIKNLTVANILNAAVAFPSAGQTGWKEGNEGGFVSNAPHFAYFNVTAQTAHTFTENETIFIQIGAANANDVTNRAVNLIFNISRTNVTTPPIGSFAPYAGAPPDNSSINRTTATTTNYWVCINATAHDPEDFNVAGDDATNITVIASVWNSTFFVNFTMTDTGTTSCDGVGGDYIYGVEINSSSTVDGATWNFSHLIVNDSAQEFNRTIINRRWNTSLVTNTAPQITLITLDDDFVPSLGVIDLTALGTKNAFCNGTVTDVDGGAEISKVNATFYHVVSTGPTAADSNATHYTNQTCFLSAASGNNKFFECLFLTRYFANNGTWQCNATAYDASTFQSNISNATINTLAALSIPSSINFGSLDPGATSLVNKTNITNAGNIQIDLSIYGFANNATVSDNSFNCTSTIGDIRNNISLYYLRYNVTDTTGAQCTNFNWTTTYWNATNISNAKNWTNFNLGKQTAEGTLMRNNTCWIVQIPPSIPASTCRGIVSISAFIDEP